MFGLSWMLFFINDGLIFQVSIPEKDVWLVCFHSSLIHLINGSLPMNIYFQHFINYLPNLWNNVVKLGIFICYKINLKLCFYLIKPDFWFMYLERGIFCTSLHSFQKIRIIWLIFCLVNICSIYRYWNRCNLYEKLSLEVS